MPALALVAPAFAQGAGQAQVRVAHLAPDAPNVDVYVNGDPVLTDVAYTTVSGYLSLPAGTQQVTVYATGDTTSPVIDTPVELAAGGAYTVAAVGLVADDSLTAQSTRMTSGSLLRATPRCASSTPPRTLAP